MLIKRIIIGQTPHQSSPFAELITQASCVGVSVHFLPLIHLQPLAIDAVQMPPLPLADYTAFIFTSQQAVACWAQLLLTQAPLPPRERVYFCVSKATADCLQALVLEAVHLPEAQYLVGNRSASDLYPLLAQHPKERYLFVCGAQRRDELPQYLQAQGFDYHELVLYHTCPQVLLPQEDLPALGCAGDFVVLCSPSAVHALLQAEPHLRQSPAKWASLGPSTTQALLKYNLVPTIESPQSNKKALAQAIQDYLIP